MEKERLLTGVQSSGNLTIGNYLGSIKSCVLMQEKYESFYMIADLHTLTVRKTPEELRENKKSLLALYLACGLDPKKSCIFMQSSVSAHSELSWILGCNTYVGELNRMTQFKDKSRKNETNVNSGLLTYPVLMASDILLYSPSFVPVGDDQRQHMELTRKIAERFNNIYGNTFKIPKEESVNSIRIKGLQNPNGKMSKSGDNLNDAIYMLDDEETIDNKIKRAVTDSDNKVYYDVENKPGVSNLLTIYAEFKNINIKEAEEYFKDATYKEFKEEVAKAIKEVLLPIREKYYKYLEDEEYLANVIEEGKEKASKIANIKLKEVQDKIGITIFK